MMKTLFPLIATLFVIFAMQSEAVLVKHDAVLNQMAELGYYEGSICPPFPPMSYSLLNYGEQATATAPLCAAYSTMPFMWTVVPVASASEVVLETQLVSEGGQTRVNTYLRIDP